MRCRATQSRVVYFLLLWHVHKYIRRFLLLVTVCRFHFRLPFPHPIPIPFPVSVFHSRFSRSLFASAFCSHFPFSFSVSVSHSDFPFLQSVPAFHSHSHVRFPFLQSIPIFSSHISFSSPVSAFCSRIFLWFVKSVSMDLPVRTYTQQLIGVLSLSDACYRNAVPNR